MERARVVLARRVNIRARVRQHASLAMQVRMRQLEQHHVRLVLQVITMTTQTPAHPAFHVVPGSTAQVETQIALIARLENTMTTTTPAHPAFYAVPGSTAQVKTQIALIVQTHPRTPARRQLSRLKVQFL